MYAKNIIKNFDKVREHVLKEYPNEAGGLVLKTGRFVPCQNVSDSPKDSFEISMKDWVKYDGKVKAVLHSHPYHQDDALDVDPRTPSKADLQGQIDTDVEWCIVVTEGENVTEPFWFGDYDHRPPLMDREFIHNMQDCLAFMSDWQYLEYGLKLPSHPRDYDWFMKGENHFEEQYEGWGFVDVTHLPEARGDVVFFKIQSDVVNHIGVVPEPGLIAHHKFGRFPEVENAQKWNRHVTRRIRHKTNPAYKGDK